VVNANVMILPCQQDTHTRRDWTHLQISNNMSSEDPADDTGQEEDEGDEPEDDEEEEPDEFDEEEKEPADEPFVDEEETKTTTTISSGAASAQAGKSERTSAKKLKERDSRSKKMWDAFTHARNEIQDEKLVPDTESRQKMQISQNKFMLLSETEQAERMNWVMSDSNHRRVLMRHVEEISDEMVQEWQESAHLVLVVTVKNPSRQIQDKITDVGQEQVTIYWTLLHDLVDGVSLWPGRFTGGAKQPAPMTRYERRWHVRATLMQMIHDRKYQMVDPDEKTAKALTRQDFDDDGDDKQVDQHMKFLAFDPVNEQKVLCLFRPKPSSKVLNALMDVIHHHGIVRCIFVTVDKGVSSHGTSIAKEHESKIHFEIFSDKEMIRNIRQHSLQPSECTILTAEAKNKLKEKWKVDSLSQLAQISVADPIARHYGVAVGDVMYFKRQSPICGVVGAWRIVVPKSTTKSRSSSRKVITPKQASVDEQDASGMWDEED